MDHFGVICSWSSSNAVAPKSNSKDLRKSKQGNDRISINNGNFFLR